jgi:hypothetical protein
MSVSVPAVYSSCVAIFTDLPFQYEPHLSPKKLLYTEAKELFPHPLSHIACAMIADGYLYPRSFAIFCTIGAIVSIKFVLSIVVTSLKFSYFDYNPLGGFVKGVIAL